MKPKRVVGYKCHECGLLHEDKQQAWGCCSDEEFSEMWQCAECGTTFDSKKKAVKCCEE